MANSQDIDAVTEYIESQRTMIPQYPELKDAIIEYEQWLSNLTWFGRNIDSDTSFAEAKWYRDRINTIINDTLPEDWVPADAAKAAETAPTPPGLLAKISPTTKYSMVAGGIALAALLVYTGPMYLGAILSARKPRLPKPENRPLG